MRIREKTELTFVNDNGASITMRSGERRKYCVQSVDFGEISEDTYTAKIPLEHGELYESLSLAPRDVVGKAYLFEDGDKAEVAAALSPLTECTLIVQGRRFLRGKLIGTPKFEYYPFTSFSFTFRAFSPFFMERTKSFYSGKVPEFELTNNGDVATPLRITLYGENYVAGDKGPFGHYPRFESATLGKFILFEEPNLGGKTRGLMWDETIVAETDITQKTIVWNKSDGSAVDAYPLMAITSSFFGLTKGKNIFRLSAKCYTSESSAAFDVDGLTVKLEYNERFFEWR